MNRPRHPRREDRDPGSGGLKNQGFFPLPEEVASQAKWILSRPNAGCIHAGLWLDRFVEWERDKPTKYSNERKKVIESLSRSCYHELLSAYRRRWCEMLDTYQAQGYVVRRFSLRAASRVVVGLGAESVLETSICLHRIYGFPIIPGSALKGLARAYARLLNSPSLVEIFGAGPPEAKAGKVIFFDAIPDDPHNLELQLDVMNPHYAPYYQGSAPPADYHSPIPIFFLTIAPGSRFLFALASECENLASQAEEYLKEGLMKLGIGAKTTAGYGLWGGV